jgi:hypothetical protein
MAMARTTAAFTCGLWLVVLGCSEGERLPPGPVDCSVADAYEFRNISDFSGSESGWYRYADPTPGGVPDPDIDGSNVPVTELEPPGRCGDTRIMKLEARGLNFWGSGFGDWAHNQAASRADGTGYEGISFWARSPVYAEKMFLLNVDDSRTIILPPDPPDAGLLPVATPADQDLDGDGFVGPGDIARGTQCRLPPPVELGEAPCYRGGVDAPASAGSRVPAPDECGNAFHTRITTAERWQLFLIPWNELVQWPCPNRLEGGINPADVAKFEIKLRQGTHYEIWIDNIAFYRRRADAGS